MEERQYKSHHSPKRGVQLELRKSVRPHQGNQQRKNNLFIYLNPLPLNLSNPFLNFKYKYPFYLII